MAEPTLTRTAAVRLAATLLAVAIVAGSAFVWIGIPAGFVWLSSKVTRTLPQALAIMLVACPLTMVVFGVLLSKLNSAYLRARHSHPDQLRAAWLGSLSGGRSPRRPAALLEVSMTLSATIALVALLVWFFFFAHSSLPAPF